MSSDSTDEDRKIASTSRPALSKLEADHDDLVTRLRDGFETSEDLLFWLQEVSVATLGCFPDEDLTDAFVESNSKACLIVGSDRHNTLLDEPPGLDHAKWFRLGFEETFLMPAFRQSYRKLRKNANEYVRPEDRPVTRATDPVALRPALEELHDRQRETIEDVLTGFESDEELLDWVRGLIGASYGQIDRDIITGLRLSDKVARDNLRSDPNLQHSLDGDHESDWFRKSLVAVQLLPAFNAGVRKLVDRAGEETSEEEEDENGDVGDHISA